MLLKIIILLILFSIFTVKADVEDEDKKDGEIVGKNRTPVSEKAKAMVRAFSLFQQNYRHIYKLVDF